MPQQFDNPVRVIEAMGPMASQMIQGRSAQRSATARTKMQERGATERTVMQMLTQQKIAAMQMQAEAEEGKRQSADAELNRKAQMDVARIAEAGLNLRSELDREVDKARDKGNLAAEWGKIGLGSIQAGLKAKVDLAQMTTNARMMMKLMDSAAEKDPAKTLGALQDMYRRNETASNLRTVSDKAVEDWILHNPFVPGEEIKVGPEMKPVPGADYESWLNRAFRDMGIPCKSDLSDMEDMIVNGQMDEKGVAEVIRLFSHVSEAMQAPLKAQQDRTATKYLQRRQEITEEINKATSELHKLQTAAEREKQQISFEGSAKAPFRPTVARDALAAHNRLLDNLSYEWAELAREEEKTARMRDAYGVLSRRLQTLRDLRFSKREVDSKATVKPMGGTAGEVYEGALGDVSGYSMGAMISNMMGPTLDIRKALAGVTIEPINARASIEPSLAALKKQYPDIPDAALEALLSYADMADGYQNAMVSIASGKIGQEEKKPEQPGMIGPQLPGQSVLPAQP